jgi:hypothetical protein
MTIYKSARVLPYVYMSKEKNSLYFYIGYRYANYLPSAEDFGKKYFTSNKYVRENFDKFEHTIIAEFFTKEYAYEFEADLIKETRSEYQINYNKYKKIKGKKYNKIPSIEPLTKLCALPECQKPHNNWRMKCCCKRHNNIYAARKK